jgi:hypothetical protein
MNAVCKPMLWNNIPIINPNVLISTVFNKLSPPVLNHFGVSRIVIQTSVNRKCADLVSTAGILSKSSSLLIISQHVTKQGGG